MGAEGLVKVKQRGRRVTESLVTGSNEVHVSRYIAKAYVPTPSVTDPRVELGW